jgi:WD40 repeat protein
VNARGSSKDALIRVWDRETLELHCTFRGHEGPVNAVGMESGRVVSASGDGKMMLWEIPDVRDDSAAVVGRDSGAGGFGPHPVRVFEGHERGLACIEFKVRIPSPSYSVRSVICAAIGRRDSVRLERLQDQSLARVDGRVSPYADGARPARARVELRPAQRATRQRQL